MRKNKKKFEFFLFCSLSFALLGGCASSQIKELPFENDPYEPMNRAVFAFNQGVEKGVLQPVATGYRAVVPAFFRDSITNVFNTLKQPAYFANSLLQGELKDSGWVILRTAVNLSFGFFGLFDVASEMQIPAPNHDFGQTMAKWGWHSGGPYLVLPILGPSNPRDALGLGADALMDISRWELNHEPEILWGTVAVYGVNQYEKGMDLLENLKNSSTDYYAALRTMYLQNRQKKIDQAIQEGEGPVTYDVDFEIEDEEE